MMIVHQSIAWLHEELRRSPLCRLHVTFTYNMPAVGRKRGRAMAGTQLAVLQVRVSSFA